MPSKVDKLRVPNSFDKRIKLSISDKEEIKTMYQAGAHSYNQIALLYGVSKSLVILIVNPDIEERKKQQYKERRKDGRYYKRETHTLAMYKHRKHKEEIYK